MISSKFPLPDSLYTDGVPRPTTQDSLKIFEGDDRALAVEEFVKIWMREHEAPELLDYEDVAVTFMFKAIHQQQAVISSVPSSSDALLISNLLCMEQKRLSYLVNSYLRLRLQKLLKHPFYYREHEIERQSAPEHQFITKFLEIYEDDLRRNLWDKLPPELNVFSMGEEPAGPELDEHVVCRSLVHANGFAIDDFGGSTDLEPGTILCLPYRFVRDLVHNKQVDLF